MNKKELLERKIRRNRIIYMSLFILLVAILGTTMLLYGFRYKEVTDKAFRIMETKEKKIERIESHYGKRVELQKDSDIYTLSDNKYQKVGLIKKSQLISLDELEINEKTEYFPIANSDYYIKYENLKPSKKEKVELETKLIPFNENVKTKSGAKFYQNEKHAMTLDEEKSLVILVKEDDYYVVIYDDELFEVKVDDVKEVFDNENTDREVAKEVPVLNYHFLYDPANKDVCNQIICLKISVFKQHLQYLKDNNFMALTMREFEMWYSKKIRIPKKAVLITFDDGTIKTDKYLGPILEEYETPGTLFLVTSWFDYKIFKNDYLEVHSHGHNMHGISKPSPALKMSKEELSKDFDASIAALDGENTGFAYPFYQYNDRILEVVKTKFKVAFIGGNRKAKQSHNRYLLPRIVIFDEHNLEAFKKLVN